MASQDGDKAGLWSHTQASLGAGSGTVSPPHSPPTCHRVATRSSGKADDATYTLSTTALSLASADLATRLVAEPAASCAAVPQDGSGLGRDQTDDCAPKKQGPVEAMPPQQALVAVGKDQEARRMTGKRKADKALDQDFVKCPATLCATLYPLKYHFVHTKNCPFFLYEEHQRLGTGPVPVLECVQCEKAVKVSEFEHHRCDAGMALMSAQPKVLYRARRCD